MVEILAWTDIRWPPLIVCHFPNNLKCGDRIKPSNTFLFSSRRVRGSTNERTDARTHVDLNLDLDPLL